MRPRVVAHSTNGFSQMTCSHTSAVSHLLVRRSKHFAKCLQSRDVKASKRDRHEAKTLASAWASSVWPRLTSVLQTVLLDMTLSIFLRTF